MVAALRHFRFLLEGHSFHMLTNHNFHKLLVFTLHRARDAWSARQGRHLAYVAEFTSDLRHLAGAATWQPTAFLGPLRNSPCPGLPMWPA